MKKPRRVLLITNIPNPYRIPLFNELNKQLKSDGVDLSVIFGAKGYSRRKWEIDLFDCMFDYYILRSKKVHFFDTEKYYFSYSGLLKVIRSIKPALVIVSGFSLATVKVWLYALIYRCPYLIWSGHTDSPFASTSFARKIQRKLLIRKADGFVVYGTKAKEYLISLGAKPQKIEIAINTVDIDYFREKAGKNMDKDTKEKCLLSIGNLIPRKRFDLLLYITCQLAKKRKDFVLKIIGNGPLQPKLLALANELKINEFVKFEGLKQKVEIVNYLREADIYLFPTGHDIWGLVLNEAMASGLPCITSINAGASFDLIQDSTNGFIMDFTRTTEVSEKLEWMLDHPEQIQKIGREASSFIFRKASLKISAQGFTKAVHKALDSKVQPEAESLIL